MGQKWSGAPGKSTFAWAGAFYALFIPLIPPQPQYPLECPVGGRKSSSPKNNDPWGIIRRSRNKI